MIQSSEFKAWLSGLRDRQGRNRILGRINRLTAGNPGDVKSVGEGVSEMRIHHGPGYRVYFAQNGVVTVVLLCGGNKATQAGDIVRAKALAVEWREAWKA